VIASPPSVVGGTVMVSAQPRTQEVEDGAVFDGRVMVEVEGRFRFSITPDEADELANALRAKATEAREPVVYARWREPMPPAGGDR
jgi:hypothetical protein